MHQNRLRRGTLNSENGHRLFQAPHDQQCDPGPAFHLNGSVEQYDKLQNDLQIPSNQSSRRKGRQCLDEGSRKGFRTQRLSRGTSYSTGQSYLELCRKIRTEFVLGSSAKIIFEVDLFEGFVSDGIPLYRCAI
jgi:hypothetical protein